MGSALCTLFRHDPVNVLYFGLNAAGKTTLLYHLKLGELLTATPPPTMGFNVETFQYNGVDMMTWDVGSRNKVRPVLRHVTPDLDAVVFVVDSTDRERLQEAAREFFTFVVPDIHERQVPVVVLANKQDKVEAMTPQEVKDAVVKQGTLDCDWEVFPTTALTLDGVDLAMEWLTVRLAANLARQTWLSSATVRETLIHYPASLLKSSLFRVSQLFASDERYQTASLK